MTNQIKITNQIIDTSLNKGFWIVILHAHRIPPHVGLLFNGTYFSLNLKGIEKNIELAVLLRTIELQNIKSIFIKVKKHPVFSVEYLKEVFENDLSNYQKVTTETTCFKPVKLFFEEHYLFCSQPINFLFELFSPLIVNEMIEKTIALNLKEDIIDDNFTFNTYNAEDIKDKLASIKSIQHD
jgi:hypothetical protein